MDIDTLIETPDLTWRDILYEIINGMDPWDIDISELATRYSKRVKEMREMNFRIPANVVLVSSVLLRMKADIMNPYKTEPYTELADSFNFMFGQEFPDASLLAGGNGDLNFEIGVKPMRVPTRRVTAEELIAAIQKALEERTTRKSRLLLKPEDNGHRDIVIDYEVDFTVLIEETYRRVVSILSQKEVALFSELAKTRDERISVFMSLLHLSNNQRVHLRQERLFEEIYIRHTPFLD